MRRFLGRLTAFIIGFAGFLLLLLFFRREVTFLEFLRISLPRGDCSGSRFAVIQLSSPKRCDVGGG